MSSLRLPLTARLTVLFTLVAAMVLLGLGVLVAWATARHFVELDRMFLDDKAHLVEKLVSEAGTPAVLRDVLDDMLDSHKGLFVQVWLGGELVYGQQALTQNLLTDSPATTHSIAIGIHCQSANPAGVGGNGHCAPRPFSG